MFDVSQTSGAELPSFLDGLHGEIPVEQKKAILTALQKAVGIPIAFEDIQGTAKDYYSASEVRKERCVSSEFFTHLQASAAFVPDLKEPEIFHLWDGAKLTNLLRKSIVPCMM